MFQLYCAQNTYAMGPHALLEELGLPYELRTVELFADGQPDDFLAASPHARVPALVHAGGTICESDAIALFLTDSYDEPDLGIAPGHPDRGKYLQWLFYLSSTVQPEVLIQFHPEFYFNSAQDQTRLQRASMKRLNGAWSILNDIYDANTWLFENRPTAVDICLGIPLLWPECFANGIEEFPSLHRMRDALIERPAFQRMMQWHRLDFQRAAVVTY